MGKLLYLIGGGVGLIAEASSRRSGRDNSGGGNGGRGECLQPCLHTVFLADDL